MKNIITRILNKNEEEDWIVFTEKNKVNYFQGHKAYRHFNAANNYNPIVIICKQDGHIIGSLHAVVIVDSGLKGLFSKRCIVWGGPIIDKSYTEQNKVADLLIRTLNKSHNAIFTEFRNLSSTQPISKAFQDNGFKFIEHLNYLVKIGANIDDSFTLLNTSKRRQVRKTVKEGVRIEIAKTIDQVKEFYNILNYLYRTKVKKPLPSFQFFESFFNNESGVFLLIIKEDEMLGGIMCPIDQDIIYEYYIAGLDGKYKNIYPSVLATWAPIEYATKNHLSYFDFLGAGNPKEDYGVRDFKSKFGGQLLNYGRYRLINKPIMYKIGLLGLKLIQKIK